MGKTGRKSVPKEDARSRELPVVDMRPGLARGPGKIAQERIRRAVEAVMRGRLGRGDAAR